VQGSGAGDLDHGPLLISEGPQRFLSLLPIQASEKRRAYPLLLGSRFSHSLFPTQQPLTSMFHARLNPTIDVLFETPRPTLIPSNAHFRPHIF
jgi:hypothetical protein